MSADSPFERLAILGLGLLGGSVAMAARERGLARTIVGAGRRRAPLDYALERGIVDEAGDVRAATRGADLVLLCTPVSSMAGVLTDVAGQLAPGAIVTDVGSVKGKVAETLPGLLPAGACFIGSHPMAGSHHKGVEHARADLFEGTCCVITPLSGTEPAPVARLSRFWAALGSRVLERSPGEHDEHAAWISHAPHALAFAFAHALGAGPHKAGELAGSGFRDFTRIARSDAELWGDILSANRKALAAPLEAFGRSLSELVRVIEEGDVEKVEQFLTSAGDGLTKMKPGGADD
ncbi:MAG: prephenate dehydrogenase/arogenate dehydrogenase family protein [bacterium]|nr:prephenate dehydrogenase/arogenate dehydrogenase family protein [bacterium]MCP5039657.1 prephenate dehydrogenase/arogenate dehydrogenase family protein [bacterium]